MLTSLAAVPRTTRRIAPGVAPTAIRMPNSRVLLVDRVAHDSVESDGSDKECEKRKHANDRVVPKRDSPTEP